MIYRGSSLNPKRSPLPFKYRSLKPLRHVYPHGRVDLRIIFFCQTFWRCTFHVSFKTFLVGPLVVRRLPLRKAYGLMFSNECWWVVNSCCIRNCLPCTCSFMIVSRLQDTRWHAYLFKHHIGIEITCRLFNWIDARRLLWEGWICKYLPWELSLRASMI